jgi:hypothetical protein
MIRVSIIILALLTQCCLAGSSLTPDGVVRAAIDAAHQENSDLLNRCCDFEQIAKQPRHSMTRESLVSLFKSFNIEEVEIEPFKLQGDSATITIRMIKPLRLDFNLAGFLEENGVRWRIVAVHP